MRRIGLVSPGEMGAAVGSELVRAGHSVAWASAGRGTATRARAEAAGLKDLATLGRLAGECDLIFSIVPPQFALATALAVAWEGFRGLYVDANAIAPTTTKAVGATVAEPGAGLVDGGLIGPPPEPGRAVRLYLSGERAKEVADVCRGTAIETRVLGAEVGSASALKLAYALWSKGSAALLLTAHDLAASTGVEDALFDEWKRSQSGLQDRLQDARQAVAAKGWRWGPEMTEIARALFDAGLSSEFAEAAGTAFAEYGSSS